LFLGKSVYLINFKKINKSKYYIKNDLVKELAIQNLLKKLQNMGLKKRDDDGLGIPLSVLFYP